MMGRIHRGISTLVGVVAALSVLGPVGRAQSFQTGQQAQRPTFRLDTNAVLVDATVQGAQGWVDDLTAGEFRLTDQGVPQQVVLLSRDRVPLDLTCYIDISGSVRESSSRVWKDIRDGIAQLRVDDRLRLVTIDHFIRELLPLRAAPFELPVDDPPTSTLGTAVHDAIVQASTQPGTPGRRNVVLVVTDGDDRNWSVSTTETMRAVAARTEALMIVALVEPHWPPYDRDAVKADREGLRDVIQRSGGTVVEAKDLPAAFVHLFQALDRTYLLAYTPQGVSGDGWHEVRVTVTRPGTYEVRARLGYFGSSEHR